MKYLLDTHALIWFLTGETHRFSPAMLEILQNDAETLYFSAASIWEITIKSTLGKADFRISAQTIHNELLAQDFLPLPIEAQHAIHTAHLPPIHHDPFDRLLLAQAEQENLILLTADQKLHQYGKPWIQPLK